MEATESKADRGNKNLIVLDTNVAIVDPYCLRRFAEGNNHVVIPLRVVNELDSKKNDPKIGYNAREAMREINSLTLADNSSFTVETRFNMAGLGLDPDKTDHIIIATFNYILKSREYAGYKKYKLVSNDIGVRTVSRAIFKKDKRVSIDEYLHNVVQVEKIQKDIPKILLDTNPLSINLSAPYDPKVFGRINQNGGIIINYDEEKENLFVRKGESLVMIKNNQTLFGLKAINGDDNPNYEQLLAFHLLQDRDISCVILEGGAGTGKTLMALTAGLFQKKFYDSIIVSNPMVPLSGKDSMGFLPGDIQDKIIPWIQSCEQNLEFLEKNLEDEMLKLERGVKEKNKEVKKSEEGVRLCRKYKICFKSLQYIRGQTIRNTFYIVEEPQNLTPHEMKTMITRLGEGSKIVFCGDLAQIDAPYLSENSSGLAYILDKMPGESEEAKMIGVSRLTKSVRSKLVDYAKRVL